MTRHLATTETFQLLLKHTCAQRLHRTATIEAHVHHAPFNAHRDARSLILRPSTPGDLDAIQTAKEDAWDDSQLWMAWAFDD